MLRSVKRRSLTLVLALALVAPTAAFATKPKKSKKVRPIAKIDRTRVVGAPVLTEESTPGIYVWLEDGELRFAAVPRPPDKKNRPRVDRYAVKVISTKPVKRKSGDFRVAGGGAQKMRLEAVVKQQVARGAVKTKGDVKITDASRGGKRVPIFVGPLAKRAAPTVEIGRF